MATALRRSRLRCLVLGLFAMASEAVGSGSHPHSDALRIFVGGYSGVVTTLDYHPKSRSFEKVAETANGTFGEAPSWLTLDPTNTYIFSVDEVDAFEGKDQTGAVFSGSVGKDGKLKKISQANTGAGPVSCDLSRDGRSLAVASYSNGSLWRYEIDSRTKHLSKPAAQKFFFKGSGPNLDRQDQSYAHEVRYDPSGRLAFVPDLGSDRLRLFRSNADDSLTELEPVTFPAGSGPRHVSFRPPSPSHGQKSFVYVICELSNTISTLTYEDDGAGSPKVSIEQTVSILPPNVNATTFGASEVALSPDGRFLYAGNRQTDTSGPIDDNAIAIFSRDSSTGHLTCQGFHPVGGKLPRHFSLDPTGRYLVVGAQGSNLVLMHERDAKTGRLTKVAETSVDSPAVQIFTNPQRHP